MTATQPGALPYRHVVIPCNTSFQLWVETAEGSCALPKESFGAISGSALRTAIHDV